MPVRSSHLVAQNELVTRRNKIDPDIGLTKEEDKYLKPLRLSMNVSIPRTIPKEVL